MPGFFTPVIKEEFGIDDNYTKQLTRDFNHEISKFRTESDEQLERVDKMYRERIN